MPDVTKPQPLVPEGIEVSLVPRPEGYVELKRAGDGTMAVLRTDCDISKLHWAANMLRYDDLLTLFLGHVPLYKNGERLRSVTSGNWTARR